MLLRKECHKKERLFTKNNSIYYKYYFYCSVCSVEISSQHNYLKKHSGKCVSCSQKKVKYTTCYTQLLGNKKRNIQVELTFDEYVQIREENNNCHYCYIKISKTIERGKFGYRGYFLDRKHNNIGYTKDNCVLCCWKCNSAKGNRYSYDEWYEMTKMFRKEII